jgi:iron complex transport system substrate-binding protein
VLACVRMFLLALVLAIVAGCTGAAVSPTAVSSPTAVTATPTATTSPSPVTVRDDAGRTVTFTTPPQRIVSAAPSATELAFAIGLGDEVVAVDKFSNYPPAAASRTSIGSYTQPDLEAILGAKPDLVLVTDVHIANLVPWLDAQKIPTLVLAAKSIEGVLVDLALVGRVGGQQAKADELVSQLRARIAAVEAKVAGSDPVSVFYELDPTLFTPGPGTFIDDIIRRAGGRNIAAGATTAYPQLSSEEVITANPAVIILADEVAGVTADAVAARPGSSKVSAVATKRIVAIDADIGSRPGPRVVDALERIAAALHPTP